MTKEQYLKEVAAIRKVIAQQEAEISRIETEYIEANKPCNIGDRFVLSGISTVEITKLGIDYNGNVVPIFYRRVNKGGELSKVESRIYSFQDTLKPIKK
jgi:hypothetical protein